MSNTNRVILYGHLVKSADLSRWADGSPYCIFSIAVNESYKDQNGEWVSIPSYFDCMIKGAYAESISKHLLKGRGVTVDGKLKQQRWEKDGVKASRVIIKVQELDLAPIANTGPRAEQNKPAVTFEEIPSEELDYVPFDEGEGIPF